MKKIICSILIIGALLGCTQKTKEGASTPAISAQKVTISEVKYANTNSAFRYSGSIEASQTIPLSFQTTGMVEKVLVEAGDHVSKGQLLATVEKSSSQNMYDMAYSKYQQAKDAYDRLKSVYEKGSLPEIKWVEMQTGLDQAKSSVEMAKGNLEKCELRAPSDGVIGKRNIEPGMSALSIASAPFELVDLKELFVKISVPENEIGKLKKDQNAVITVSALDNRTYEGTIHSLSPLADQFSRTYEAKIKVKNQDNDMKPGMICDVNVLSAGSRFCLLVPYRAVTKESDGVPYLFVVNKTTKKVKKTFIKVGNYAGSDIEVLSGLGQGDYIVLDGKEKLADNELISY